MRKEVKTKDAPEAIGPYSQGISAAGFVFVSGQLPIDPVTGGFPEGGIENQTRQALRNLKAVL
jgi:2-iminobutanoate/2-iminopropanoate deaminase